MITLKKAFETQNTYKQLFNEARFFLMDSTNVTRITENSYKSKATKNEEDELGVVVPKNSTIECDVLTMVDFAQFMAKEIGKLTTAINTAKAASDYDGKIAINSVDRSLLEAVSFLANLKPSEKTQRTTGFTFNAEGNQVSYYFDKTTVTEIDYDRKAVKAIERKLRKGCSDVSDNIDELQLTIKVDYDPIFQNGDTFEDAIEVYKTIR